MKSLSYILVKSKRTHDEEEVLAGIKILISLNIGNM